MHNIYTVYFNLGATPKGIGMGLMTLEKQVQVLAVSIFIQIPYYGD